MNNQEILKKRWQFIDKKLNDMLKMINKLTNTKKDKLQEIFDGIKFTANEIDNYADVNYVNKLHRKINNALENGELSEYNRFVLNKYKKKKKIKNRDVLLTMIMLVYQEEQNELDKLEKLMFKDIGEYVYNDAQLEAIEVSKGERFEIFKMTDVLIATLLSLPTFKGYTWETYKDGDSSYKAKQTYSLVVLNMQQGKELDVNNDEFEKLFNKQNKTYLNKKKDNNEVDKFSGALDNYVSWFTNQVALEGMKKQGVKEVIFIAIEDDVTTDMCKSLNGQVFKIYEWNTFSRYSKEDDKNIIYKVKGLQVGANLPPIDNGFHYCRSTIYPVR